jgi:hypothetical protein
MMMIMMMMMIIIIIFSERLKATAFIDMRARAEGLYRAVNRKLL